MRRGGHTRVRSGTDGTDNETRRGSVAVTGGLVVALHVVLAAVAYPAVAAAAVTLGVVGFLSGVGLASVYDQRRNVERTVCVPGTDACVQV